MEDGLPAGVERIRKRLLVRLPVAQDEDDGHHYQVRLLLGCVCYDVLQFEVQSLPLLQGERFFDENGTKLGEG